MTIYFFGGWPEFDKETGKRIENKDTDKFGKRGFAPAPINEAEQEKEIKQWLEDD